MILLISIRAGATNYYISNTGSDAAAGTSTGTPWQTISKVNAVTFAPGDSILFKKGDTWNERLNPPSSGTAGNPIIFSCYGTGNKPIITGFQTQAGFTNVGNIWTATATNSVKQQNTVMINGTLAYMARTPNTGWSTYTNSTATTLTTALTGTPNYTGSNLVIRDAHWIIDRVKITSQSTGTLNFNPAGTYTSLGLALGGNGYFIQNTVSDLDVAGEYQYDSTTKVLKVFATSSPTVKISTIDTLVYLNNKNYINFYKIAFEGANKAGIRLDTANHITIDSCTLNYMGTRAVTGIHSHWARVTNDSINYVFSNSVYLRQDDPYTPTLNTCDSSTVSGNYIHLSGYIAGMGESDNGHYIGISILGHRDSITNNQVDSSGYIGINWAGKNNFIAYNYVTNHNYIKDDGGGIYSVVGFYLAGLGFDDGSEVRKNIVLHGIGAHTGVADAGAAPGIYLDDAVRQVTVDSNFTMDHDVMGLYLNGDTTCYVHDNTIVDSLGDCLWIRDNFEPTYQMNLKRNILYSQKSTTYSIYFLQTNTTQTVDSNYYLRPTAETNKWRMNATSYATLSAWQGATGYDANGHVTPTGLTGGLPLIIYNPSMASVQYLLLTNFKDATGVAYPTGTITLPPFGSKILFPATQTQYYLNNRYNRLK